MGVTAHFFAFDPRIHGAAPTTERWLAQGVLDEYLHVIGTGVAPIATWLGDNKRWSDNLAGDFAWTRARGHVPEASRQALDRWLSHLFWEGESPGCPCARTPQAVADCEVVFDHALLAHTAALACPLEPAAAALALEFDGEPPRSEHFDSPWIYDFEGFCALVSEWQRITTVALAAGPDWSLLRWVWY
jgi:hypothetical protein